MDILQYFYIFKRWAWLLILGAVLGTVSGFIYSSSQSPVYQSTTKVMVSSSLSGGASNPYALYNDQQLAQTYVQILKTKPMLENASKYLGYPISSTQISVAQVDDRTPIIVITVEAGDSQQAADIANQLVVVLIEQNQNLQAGQYAASEESLQVQISQVEQQIAKYQTDLDNLSSKSISDQIEQVKNQMEPLQAEVSQLQKDIALLTPAFTQEKKVQLAEKETRLSQLTPLLNLYQQIYTNLVVLGSPGSSIDNNSLVLTRLQSTLDLYQQIYLNLINSREAIRLARLQNTPNVVQIEEAGVSKTPIRPRPLNNALLAGVFGLLLAGSVAFIIEFLDDTIKTPEDVEKQLGLPVIGYIGDMQDNEKDPEQQLLYVNSKPRSPVAEAFRSLRANLEFASVDKQLKTLLITSPGPGEGKTTVSGNLSAIISQAGRSSVLIDADLRRPRVHQMLGLSNRIGLSDLFRDHSSHTTVLNDFQSSSPLSVITSGAMPPNPTELLGSDRMVSILEELKSAFDVVVIDSPPTVVADAQVLAARVDGILLVLQPGHTSVKDALLSCEQFQRAGGHVLGVVFNRIPRNQERYYGGYQYYSSHYYNQPLGENGDDGIKPRKTKSKWMFWKREPNSLQYEQPETESELSESPVSQPTVELSAAVPVKSTPKPVLAKQEKQVSANDAEVMSASGHLDIRQDSIVGSEYRFRIYQVQRGEKLVSLARSAGTTVSAIAAVNYNFSTPFKEDQIIVIPIDQNDVSRLPSFETYRVSETIGVAELAERLHVDIDQFHLYNGIKKGNTLAEGKWVLIPRGKHK